MHNQLCQWNHTTDHPENIPHGLHCYSDYVRSVMQEPFQRILSDALITDGAHHKQWYLQILAAKLGVDVLEDYDKGVAP
jgi:hypothetical protein